MGQTVHVKCLPQAKGGQRQGCFPLRKQPLREGALAYPPCHSVLRDQKMPPHHARTHCVAHADTRMCP